MLFKKNASLKERANAALSNLQRNAYAMSMLRSRLESRINFTLNGPGNADSCQELSRVLQLVKSGELILHEMSEKIESARFLEEFVMIMDSAATSVSEIKADLEHLVPEAEAALEAMQDAIFRASSGLTPEIGQEIEPAILAEVIAAITIGKANSAVVEMKEARNSSLEIEKQVPENVPA